MIQPITPATLANIDLQPAEFVIYCVGCHAPLLLNLDDFHVGEGEGDWHLTCPHCGGSVELTVTSKGIATISIT